MTVADPIRRCSECGEPIDPTRAVWSHVCADCDEGPPPASSPTSPAAVVMVQRIDPGDAPLPEGYTRLTMTREELRRRFPRVEVAVKRRRKIERKP